VMIPNEPPASPLGVLFMLGVLGLQEQKLTPRGDPSHPAFKDQG